MLTFAESGFGNGTLKQNTEANALCAPQSWALQETVQGKKKDFQFFFKKRKRKAPLEVAHETPEMWQKVL